MKRVILLIMDSFGIGNAHDANMFGDLGSDTLGNIMKNEKLNIPNLTSLGLMNAYYLNNPKYFLEEKQDKTIKNSFWGVAKEYSKGKDTLSGHWEIAGILNDKDLTYYKNKKNSIPKNILNTIINETQISGFLGNSHASGTEIIESLGEEHLLTLKPIIYTSADSVIQIAAHEKYFGLEKLYSLCEKIREITKNDFVGRIIARPFIGENKNDFLRTKNRKDFSLEPPQKTMLDTIVENNKQVISIGKIFDIFAGKGISKKIDASGLEELFDKTLEQMLELKSDGIIFTNFSDFDTKWGHRRDVKGYAKGLEYFDKRIIEIIKQLKTNDLLIITADHGCDPTFKGTDHTRENVPILGIGGNGNIGIRDSFVDISTSIKKFLKLPIDKIGKSFI